jgi:hypothetical protein
MKAVLNEKITWECSGVGDALTCPILPNYSDRSIQIESPGVTFVGKTITAQGVTGATQVADIPAGTGAICSVGGENFSLAAVSVAGFAAGTYIFLFTAV